MSTADLSKFFDQVQGEKTTPDALAAKTKTVVAMFGTQGNLTTNQACV